VQVVLPTDRMSGRPRGFAFVEFTTEEQAAEAIQKFDGFELSGRKRTVLDGAAADLLLVDGNPLKDISVIGGRKTWFSQPAPSENPIETLRVIMKDGVIYKNSLGN